MKTRKLAWSILIGLFVLVSLLACTVQNTTLSEESGDPRSSRIVSEFRKESDFESEESFFKIQTDSSKTNITESSISSGHSLSEASSASSSVGKPSTSGKAPASSQITSSKESSSPPQQASSVPPADPNDSIIVYITRTGKRYHNENPCGNGTYYACTLSEALRRGLTPCEKCVLH